MAENIFLVRLEEGAGGAAWFRYHHLFADLLNARLRQVQPNIVHSLHVRASTWFEQNGFIAEAVQHLLAVGEVDRAADMIEQYGPARWAENDLSVVQMADSLPPEMLLARPRIGACQVWLLINQGLIEKAFPLLTSMEQQLSGAGLEPDQQWIYAFVRLALLFLVPPRNEADQDPFPDPRVLDEFPADELVLRDAADILYGMALGRRGEIDRAAEFGNRFLQREKASFKALRNGLQAIPTLVPFLAAMYWFQGRLKETASLCHEYLEPIKEKGILFTTAGNLDVVLGEVLHDWNCLEEAEKYLRDGLRLNEAWGNIMTDAFGLLSLAHVLSAKGDTTGAMQVVHKFEERLQGPLRPVEFSEDFYTLRIRVQLDSGDLSAAVDWADRLPYTEDYQKNPKNYLPILARIRLAQGRYAEVEQMLAGIPTRGLSGNRVLRQLEISLILAVAAAGQQRLPEALRILDSCLELAEPDGYIRVFLDFGAPVRELLAAYLRSAAMGHKSSAQKILEAFSRPGGVGASVPLSGGLVEPLSERELEVLRLLSLGRTNQEIASQLIVASGTVKAHTASIYRKLDVNNRTEAVSHARQLGILP